MNSKALKAEGHETPQNHFETDDKSRFRQTNDLLPTESPPKYVSLILTNGTKRRGNWVYPPWIPSCTRIHGWKEILKASSFLHWLHIPFLSLGEYQALDGAQWGWRASRGCNTTILHLWGNRRNKIERIWGIFQVCVLWVIARKDRRDRNGFVFLWGERLKFGEILLE